MNLPLLLYRQRKHISYLLEYYFNTQVVYISFLFANRFHARFIGQRF